MERMARFTMILQVGSKTGRKKGGKWLSTGKAQFVLLFTWWVVPLHLAWSGCCTQVLASGPGCGSPLWPGGVVASGEEGTWPGWRCLWRRLPSCVVPSEPPAPPAGGKAGHGGPAEPGELATSGTVCKHLYRMGPS